MKQTSKSGKGETQPPKAETLLSALLDIWGSGETDNLDAILHRDIVYDDVPNEHKFSGIEEVSGYIAHLHSWASGVEITVHSIESGRGMAIAEWTMTARQTRQMGVRIPVATRRRIRLRGMTVVRTSRGRIVGAVDYFDALTLMRQLGGRVDLPGGATLDPLTLRL